MNSLDQFEQMANDDLHLLDAVGAADYSTDYLLELRGDLIAQLADFHRRQRVNMIAAAIAGGWVLAFAGAWLKNNIWLALIALIGVVFSVGASLAGAFFLHARYKHRADLEHGLRVVEEELKRRRYTLQYGL